MTKTLQKCGVFFVAKSNQRDIEQSKKIKI